MAREVNKKSGDLIKIYSLAKEDFFRNEMKDKAPKI